MPSDTSDADARSRARRSAAYTAVLTPLSVACLVVAGVDWAHAGTVHVAAGVLAGLAIVATGFAPLTTIDSAGIYLDSAVLVALAVLVSPGEAILWYAIGELASHIALRTRPRIVAMSMCSSILASSVAVVVLTDLRGPPGSVAEFLAAVAAALANSAMMFVLISAGAWFYYRRVVTTLATMRGLLIEATAGDSLGYLTAVVVRWSPLGLLLIVSPVALLVWMSHGLQHVHSDRVRMKELVVAGDAVNAAADRDALVDVLVERTAAMLACDPPELRDEPPHGQEVGAPLELDGLPAWVVARRGLRKLRFNAQDGQALQALVRMIQSAVFNRELLADVTHQARHDPLTGLANRATLNESLTAEIRRCGRTGERFGLLYLDLNGFKPINDERGHEAGDAVLVETARRLEAAARASDLVARLGGDEFCVLATGLTEPDDALALANRIAAAVAEPLRVAGRAVTVSAAIGVALGTGRDAGDAVMHRADQAMYRAKQAHSGPVLAAGAGVPAPAPEPGASRTLNAP